jgi:uncharacterized Zn-binding protein involved in type VI secretion
MPAAARAGDNTSHGTPLPPTSGSSNVWIEGQPAWRALVDTHVCPLFDGPKAHVGGVVSKGSSKVFINGLPAARQGDQIIESGPANSISGGSLKVDIGG